MSCGVGHVGSRGSSIDYRTDTRLSGISSGLGVGDLGPHLKGVLYSLGRWENVWMHIFRGGDRCC